MAITTYTTYDTIRALLGVTNLEITDATLALPVYETVFLLELSGLDQDGGAAKTEYARIAAITPAENRTANEQAFYDIVGLFAGFSVAQQLLGSAEMFAPKNIKDGKAEIERFQDPFKNLRGAVEGGYNRLRARLLRLLVVLVPGANVAVASSRTNIVSTGLGTDPVTGV